MQPRDVKNKLDILNREYKRSLLVWENLHYNPHQLSYEENQLQIKEEAEKHEILKSRIYECEQILTALTEEKVDEDTTLL